MLSAIPSILQTPALCLTLPLQAGLEEEAAKRAESGKAALTSLGAGTVGALPFLLLDPSAFTPSWEFQADGENAPLTLQRVFLTR